MFFLYELRVERENGCLSARPSSWDRCLRSFLRGRCPCRGRSLTLTDLAAVTPSSNRTRSIGSTNWWADFRRCLGGPRLSRHSRHWELLPVLTIRNSASALSKQHIPSSLALTLTRTMTGRRVLFRNWRLPRRPVIPAFANDPLLLRYRQPNSAHKGFSMQPWTVFQPILRRQLSSLVVWQVKCTPSRVSGRGFS